VNRLAPVGRVLLVLAAVLAVMWVLTAITGGGR
jgi:hypothetical protein